MIGPVDIRRAHGGLGGAESWAKWMAALQIMQAQESSKGALDLAAEQARIEQAFIGEATQLEVYRSKYEIQEAARQREKTVQVIAGVVIVILGGLAWWLGGRK